LNFNKFPSFDFRVDWNTRNSEKQTRKFRLPSSLERGIIFGYQSTRHTVISSYGQLVTIQLVTNEHIRKPYQP